MEHSFFQQKMHVGLGSQSDKVILLFAIEKYNQKLPTEIIKTTIVIRSSPCLIVAVACICM